MIDVNRYKEKNANYWIGFLESATNLNHEIDLKEVLIFILKKMNELEKNGPGK